MRATVVLKKLKPSGSKPIVGHLASVIAKGKPITVEFLDGIHEFVTSPVVRMLTCGEKVYLTTANQSRYSLQITI